MFLEQMPSSSFFKMSMQEQHNEPKLCHRLPPRQLRDIIGSDGLGVMILEKSSNTFQIRSHQLPKKDAGITKESFKTTPPVSAKILEILHYRAAAIGPSLP